jgi:pyruvate, water dikinase
MELITWLDELRIHEAAGIGEEAAVLGELTAGGIPVVDGFVLAPTVLRRMLINAGVDPNRLREDDGTEMAWLRGRLRDDPIEPAAEALLIAAYRHLGARAGLLDPTVVLRPSVLGESAGADRGQCTTAVGAPAMIEAVRSVWSSVFDPQYLSDRRALRIVGAPSAAVVVQQALPLTRSGTAFTLDPWHPTQDVVIVEAAFGSGPDVWTGPAADEYRVDRSTLEVVQTRITAKDLVLAGNVPAPAGRHRHPRVLTDDEAAAVTRVVLDVENLLGGPQIVDFGVLPTGQVVVRVARPLDLADPT